MTIAELLRGTSPQVNWAGEDGGAGGGSPQPDAGDTSPQPKPEAEPKAEPKAEAKAEGETTEPVKEPTKEPVKADWRDNEINRLRSQLERAKTAEPKPAAPVAPAPALSTPDPDFESRVTARARELSAIEKFDADCVKAANAGKAAFGDDFTSRLKSITSNLVDPRDAASVTRYNMFLRDTLEAADGDPDLVAKVIYELGGDLNEADRVMNLSSVKRGAELARLSAKEPSAVSGAPKPLTPIGGRGEKHETIKASDPGRADSLSTASWMERRNAEVAAQEQTRRGARG